MGIDDEFNVFNIKIFSDDFDFRSPPRLLVNAAVTFKDGVDRRHVRPKLLRSRPFTSRVALAESKTEASCDRVPVNATPLRCLTAAHPVHHHRSSDLGIEFHCDLPAPPCY
jgi:hypothetical protein